jgi:AcrR family transcriptional regulator
VASQRGRMLEAMAMAVHEKGFAGATVADVIARARVSRETFYEHFADKEDCFLAAYELAADGLRSGVLAGLEEMDGAEPGARMDRIIDSYLARMAEEPALASVFLVDIYGAGPAARKRRREVFDGTVEVLARALPTRGRDQRFAVEAFVGTISALVTVRVAAGATDELPGLAAPLKRVARGMLAAA